MQPSVKRSLHRSVLIVEDEPDLAEFYASTLSTDFNITTVSTAEAALASIDTATDIVLLDRRLPDQSGTEVLKAIRDRDLPCRVILITGVKPDFDIIGLGFDDYLVKPVSPTELRRAVDQSLLVDEYNEKHRQLTSDRLTRNLLQIEKMDHDLQDNVEYHQLLDRIGRLEQELGRIESVLDPDVLDAGFVA